MITIILDFEKRDYTAVSVVSPLILKKLVLLATWIVIHARMG